MRKLKSTYIKTDKSHSVNTGGLMPLLYKMPKIIMLPF